MMVIGLSGSSNFFEKLRVARGERLESFEKIISGDAERDYTIGMSPDFVTNFRNVSFSVPVGNKQFANDSYLQDLFLPYDSPQHHTILRSRDHLILYDPWHCMPEWFEQFFARRKRITEATKRSSPRVQIRWGCASREVSHGGLQIMREHPHWFSRKEFEHPFRDILRNWRDYLRGVTYLKQRFEIPCPNIQVVSENVLKHNIFFSHEVVDDKTIVGTMVDGTVFRTPGRDLEIASFKFIDLTLVDFHCKWR